MNVSINIGQMATPVVQERKRINYASTFSSWLGRLIAKRITSYFAKVAKEVADDIDVFTLALDGATQKIDEQEIEELKNILDETKSVIKSIDDLGEKLEGIDFLDSDLLKGKYRYMQRKMYRFESKLHKAVHKTTPIIVQEQELKEGVRVMNARTMRRLLAE